MGTLSASDTLLRDRGRPAETSGDLDRRIDLFVLHAKRQHAVVGKRHGVLEVIARTYTILSNILLVGMITTMLVQWYAPTSWWIEHPKVFVQDAAAGENPLVSADMFVNRTFLLHWNLTMRRVVQDPGGYATVACEHSGAVEVHPGHRTPRNFVECKLPPGNYFMEVTYSWQNWLISREMPVQSNIFVVAPGKAS